MKVFRSIRIRFGRIIGGAALGFSLLAWNSCGGSSGQQSSGGPPSQLNFNLMVDARPDAFQYAYAPSMILKQGVYHVFFCSGGNIFPALDYVRYVKSTDGVHWSIPIIMLKAAGQNGLGLGACDPNVVLFQGFYYMFYSSSEMTGPGPDDHQTVIAVARSVNIDGPYLIYTQRGTWEDEPNDPQILIHPFVKRNQDPIGYGAGQQTVVALNGKLLMWYADDSTNPGSGLNYMLQSTDAVTWTPSLGALTTLPDATSVDVKYDAARNQFVMTRIVNQHSGISWLARSFSSDGISWGPMQVLIAENQFPNFAHNVGALGDETGNTLPSPTLVAFGAPYDLANNVSLAKWNLYGVLVDGP